METFGGMQSYVILLFLCAISSLLLGYLFKKPTKKTLHLPPSPPALPFIGHLHLLRPSASKCFHDISTKHGPLLYLRLGSRPLLLVSSATFAAEIYRTNDVAFSAKPKTPFVNGLLFGNLNFFTAPYGDYWRFMKKLCMTQLFGGRQLERSQGIRCEELNRLLHKLVEKAHKKENIDLGKELMKLTNNTICRMVMSTRCSKKDDEAERCRELTLGAIDLAGKMAVATMLGPLKKLGIWIIRKQLEDIPRGYNELLEKILKEHEERSVKREDKDFMDILLNIYYDKNSEFKISRSQLKSFILESSNWPGSRPLLQDLFIGGTDTSAGTTQWVMAELINHPNEFSKLREEIESVVGTSRLVQEFDMPNLHYLQAVVKETLRLHPIVPAIPRECRQDCKLTGFDIPKDTAVIINAYSIMRDPKLWDNPNEFFPDRFLQEENSQNKIQLQDFSFVPFGGGRRMCPGSQLALTIINITVASLVQCFDWKVDGGHKAKVTMEIKAGMTLNMADPLLCLPVVHFNPFAHIL